MSPASIAILANPDPGGHIVYPYTDESHIANAVSLFAGSGLRRGEAAILVMVKNHVEPVRQRLAAEGFDLDSLESAGQLVCWDAGLLLSKFMLHGMLDEFKFKAAIGGLIQTAKQTDGARPVRVFGEMVDLIWQEHPGATCQLEEWWNQVTAIHSVPLLCAYSLIDSRPKALPTNLLTCHSHTLS